MAGSTWWTIAPAATPSPPHISMGSTFPLKIFPVDPHFLSCPRSSDLTSCPYRGCSLEQHHLGEARFALLLLAWSSGFWQGRNSRGKESAVDMLK